MTCHHKKESIYCNCFLHEYLLLNCWNCTCYLDPYKTLFNVQCFHWLGQVVWNKAPSPHPIGVKGKCTNSRTPPDLPSTRTRPCIEISPDKTTGSWGSRRQQETPAQHGCRSCLNLIGKHSPHCKRLWHGGVRLMAGLDDLRGLFQPDWIYGESFCSTGSCLHYTHSRRLSL